MEYLLNKILSPIKLKRCAHFNFIVILLRRKIRRKRKKRGRPKDILRVSVISCEC